MTIRSFFAALFLCISQTLAAQLEDDSGNSFGYSGAYVGGAYMPNGITNLLETIIGNDVSTSTYTATLYKTWGMTSGIVFGGKFESFIPFSIQGDFNFTTKSGGYNLTNRQPLEYSIKFKYQYLNLVGSLKGYIKRGAYLRLGMYGGLNVAKHNITYTHKPNKDRFGDQKAVQAGLRKYHTGRPDLGFLAGIGYEFPSGFYIEATYVQTMTDLVFTDIDKAKEDLANPTFINPKNENQAFQLSVGYLFQLISKD